MQKSKLSLLLLILIIFFGAVLRLVDLDKNPSGLYVDEAAIGYNAYSILKTGKDEYGKVLPIFIRSYGVFASPLYTYLSIPIIYFFDLNVFSMRLLSALAGIFSILFIYLIIKQLEFYQNKKIPLVGAFLFAISPWSIFFSRGAFEANLALFIILLAIYLLLLSRKNNLFLIPSAFALALSTYTYQSERLIAFILFPGFIYTFRQNYHKIYRNKYFIIALVLFSLLQIPQLSLLFTPAFNARGSELFYQQSNAFKFLYEFFAQFFAYLSPRNLFFQGDSDLQRSLPDLSVFYPWLLIPYLTGLWKILKSKNKEILWFVILLVVSFLIAPSLTKDPFSTLRALPLILPILIIILIGLDQLTMQFKRFALGAVVILSLFSLIYFYRSYAVLLPNERAKIWGYGYKQLVEEIQKNPDTNFVIDSGRLFPVYIMYAFYTKYPPQLLQNSVDPSAKNNYYGSTKWANRYVLNNVSIGYVNWEKDICRNLIIVGDELAISEKQALEHDLTQVFEIKSPIQEILFKGYKTKPKKDCKA